MDNDCMPKEQFEHIKIIQKYMLESTNMTEDEAWDFAFRCWQCGFKREPSIPISNDDTISRGALYKAITDGEYTTGNIFKDMELQQFIKDFPSVHTGKDGR